MIFYTGVISKQVWTSLYYKEIIPHVTNKIMLRRNEYMKFLKVTFWRSSLSYKEYWIPIIHQLWKTILLHPSLCYVRIRKSSITIDIPNKMKKTLITQRKEKKFGPPPIIEMTDHVI